MKGGIKDKITRFVAGALIFVTACASITSLVFGISRNGWFRAPGGSDQKQHEEEFGGLDFDVNESQGISLMSAKIPVAMYDSYGISAQAESAYTVTATITPVDAANKKVTWSVSWKNASSTWAKGKTVTDYVTATTATDGALMVTVENKQAFGEQIILKCVSRDNAGAYATSNVEYLQKVTQYDLSFYDGVYDYDVTTGTGAFENEADYMGIVLDFDSVIDVALFSVCATKSSVYTRANPEEPELYLTLKPTDELKTTIKNAGFDSTKLSEYSFPISQEVTVLDSYMDKNWCEALCGNDVAKKNKLIDTLIAFDGDAYEFVIYTKQGGTKMFSFRSPFDYWLIADQKGVEGISINKTEIVF